MKIIETIKDVYTEQGEKIQSGYVVIECRCSEKISCTGFTNTCYNCGKDYNREGDELADRSQWGIETGESWYDCY